MQDLSLFTYKEAINMMLLILASMNSMQKI